MGGKILKNDLKNRVILSIQKEEVRQAKIWVSISLVTSLLSFVGIFYYIKNLINVFYNSGLYNYFSIIMSDTDIALEHWQYLSLSILESLPVFQIATSFVIVIIFMVSIRVLASNMRKDISFSFIN
ncbi:MAG: hypothetical protein K9L98_02290 [Candidatus Pacebacteria bacterium]|nr:hypothetical protein [Candidatus Paceibacterota bacterium]MCF7862815.1 hypothetical protein [Candidatus Paceibacterota bacterium]